LTFTSFRECFLFKCLDADRLKSNVAPDNWLMLIPLSF